MLNESEILTKGEDPLKDCLNVGLYFLFLMTKIIFLGLFGLRKYKK